MIEDFVLEFYEKLKIEYGDEYLNSRRNHFKMTERDWLYYCFSSESEF